MSSEPDPRIKQTTERQAGGFLFSTEDMDISQALDMRTRIKSESMMNVLLFYGIMSEGLESGNAKKIKGIVERLLIAHEGTGRTQAVEVLRQNFPKTRLIESGYESLDALKEKIKTDQDK
jgi:hypothetical protein